MVNSVVSNDFRAYLLERINGILILAQYNLGPGFIVVRGDETIGGIGG